MCKYVDRSKSHNQIYITKSDTSTETTYNTYCMWFGKLIKNGQQKIVSCPCRRTCEIAWEKALTCKLIMRLEMRNLNVQFRTKS